MYRFTVITQDTRYHNFLVSIPGIITTQIVGHLICAVIVLPAYFTVITTEKRKNELLSLFSPIVYSKIPPDCPIVMFDTFNHIAIILAIFVVIMFAVSQSISIGCCYYIIKTLKKNASNFSASTYKLHLILSWVLLVQLILPVGLVVIPVCGFLLIATTKMNIHKTNAATWVGECGVVIIAFFPCTTAMINIIFIKPYRVRLLY